MHHYQAPPLLLTKRLSAFLHANLSPQLQSALLTTPSGRLLSYASPSPVVSLRTQATVAASLWAIHAAASGAAARGQPGTDDDDEDGDEAAARSARLPSSVSLAFTSGAAVIIRRLRCGLLFVCIGPPPTPTVTPTASLPVEDAEAGGVESGAAAAGASSPDSAPSAAPTAAGVTPTSSSPDAAAPLPTDPTPAGSAVLERPAPHTEGELQQTTLPVVVPVPEEEGEEDAAAARATAMTTLRLQVEELARWLDGKLGALSLPEEGIGVVGAGR